MSVKQVKRRASRRGASAIATLRQTAMKVLGPRAPEHGERAYGHGVAGPIVAVPEWQPLAAENVWRVVLSGEAFGRLVARGKGGGWMLLQLDDLSDAQSEALELEPSEQVLKEPSTVL
jgi:hypothetical protein